MANSFGTVATDLIAQEALAQLVRNLQFLNNVHTDFSDANLTKGSSVTTHLVSAGSAVDFDGSAGYAASDVTQTSVDITLDQHKHCTFSLSDSERDASSVELVSRFAEASAHALGKSVVDFIFATDADETMNGISNNVGLSSSGFNLDALIDLGAEMDDAGIPDIGRWVVIHPKVLATLEKDVVGITNSTFDVGSSIVNGGVSKIRGFDLYSYNNDDFSDSAGEVAGYAGFKESLAVVSAAPSLPPESSSGSLAYVTEPNSGLTVQRREWYDTKMATFNFALTLYFGAKMPSAGRAWTITNAS
jgi:hypothetical protein